MIKSVNHWLSRSQTHLLKIFDFLLYFLTTNEDNLLAFYLVFVEIKSRFQFYGKSERKHVKYFLKMHNSEKFSSGNQKLIGKKMYVNFSFDKVWSNLSKMLLNQG